MLLVSSFETIKSLISAWYLHSLFVENGLSNNFETTITHHHNPTEVRWTLLLTPGLIPVIVCAEVQAFHSIHFFS